MNYHLVFKERIYVLDRVLSFLEKWRHKHLILIKSTVMALILFCVMLSQKASAQTLNLSLKKESLERVMEEITKQTKYDFSYNERVLRISKPITIELYNAPLQSALSKIFENQPLDFKITDGIIVVTEKKKIKKMQAEPEGASQHFITGKVSDEKNEPIAGATIRVKTTGEVVVTDKNGFFKLSQVYLNAPLEINCIGFERVTMAATLNAVIILHKNESMLDEAVVIAYGTTTKRLNTGNVSSISSREIEKQPVSNILGILSGRIPGLTATQSSGAPGSSFNLQIRGRSSITQGSQPLILVNGIPFVSGNDDINTLSSSISNPTYGGGLSPFFSIDPSSIESIEVLKDADATAIYGSRGANGVILITTKTGRVGTTSITANIRKGISQAPKGMKLMNTTQYLDMRKEAFKNSGETPDQNNAPDLTLWDQNRFTDLRKELIGNNAENTDARISISGGTAETQFLLSGGYYRETNVFPDNLPNTRGSMNANIEHQSSDKKFKIALAGNYVTTLNKANALNLVPSVFSPPNIPSFFDNQGNLIWEEKGAAIENPYAYLLKTYKAQTGNLMSSLNVSYKIYSGLTIKGLFGYNQLIGKEKSINPKSSMSPTATTAVSSSDFGNSERKGWNIEPQIEYKKEIGSSSLNILLGSTFQQTETSTETIQLSGFSSDDLLESMSAASTIDNVSNNYRMYRYQAVFGRINYNIKNKYLLNITGRRDGSSRFAPNRQFSNFGAIGSAWIFSGESFLKNNFPVLSYGKLRSSFGITGNDQIGDYQYLDAWAARSDLSYQGVSSLSPINLFNSNYGWEKNKKIEAALDLGFMKDRILLRLAYYNNRSSNQLILYKLPYQTGFGSITDNFPALVENSGWEFEVTAQLLKRRKFSWVSNFNITIPKNKLLRFSNLENSSYASSLVIGESLNSLYNYRSLGVNPQTGLFHFLDVKEDGILSAKDYMINGNLDPRYYGGFSNTLEFKGIQLDILFDFKKQTGRNFLHSLYQGGITRTPGTMTNQPIEILQRWQNPGDQAPYEKFSWAPNANRADVLLSNAVYSDQSFMRLRSLRLAYNFSNKVLSKIRAKNANIYFQGQNLWVSNRDKGYDPEVQALYYLPILRSLNLGIQITF